ncbi:cytochrome c peroxidase [Sulfuricurvum sp.]|uniref:cytochrome-c peroxidase n=1 Tax=Sulfuricurvum sp. TaxID=2025608 RepID=UPI00262F514E|nr:cytochrome c peroxidase [Sulfuricurvum sp.]MDD2266723.1 cytochrome c peroxidase [Sulfuricurvum sp.]MDD2784337.1 cytochrome c peroxidase [Sulfuricurvum sp.]
MKQMKQRYIIGTLSAIAFCIIVGCKSDATSDTNTTTTTQEVKITEAEKIALGKAIFFDTNLSDPVGQSCASCHSPEAGFANPNHSFPTSEGAVAGLFADRNAPTIAYSQYSPEFYYDGTGYVGGQFLDGRAATLELQAGGPPLNPVEMHNASKESYISKIAQAPYADEFKRIYGQSIFADENKTYAAIGDALATYERTSQLSKFTSKFDAFQKGDANLTAQEKLGLDLFIGKAKCFVCHPVANEDLTTVPALFTEYDYENIGVPKNPNNKFYTLSSEYNPDGANYVDIGLARNPQVIADGRVAQSRGKFKTPTLRNVELTGPYMHNGVFTTLKQVVSFYNTRDSDPARWGTPEVAENVNKDFIGDLKLTNEEEDAIVAFLMTLTDGYTH